MRIQLHSGKDATLPLSCWGELASQAERVRISSAMQTANCLRAYLGSQVKEL